MFKKKLPKIIFKPDCTLAFRHSITELIPETPMQIVHGTYANEMLNTECIMSISRLSTRLDKCRV